VDLVQLKVTRVAMELVAVHHQLQAAAVERERLEVLV
jgi:hypothetical protein